MAAEKQVEYDPKDPRTWSIAERVGYIQTHLGPVKKSGYNNYSHYTYPTEGDIYDAFKKPQMFARVTFQIKWNKPEIDPEDRTRTTISGEVWAVSWDDRGDIMAIPIYGETVDKDSKGNRLDKGIPQAMTLASKYGFIKMLQIASSEESDPDAGHGSRSDQGGQSQQKGNQQQQQQKLRAFPAKYDKYPCQVCGGKVTIGELIYLIEGKANHKACIDNPKQTPQDEEPAELFNPDPEPDPVEEPEGVPIIDAQEIITAIGKNSTIQAHRTSFHHFADVRNGMSDDDIEKIEKALDISAKRVSKKVIKIKTADIAACYDFGELLRLYIFFGKNRQSWGKVKLDLNELEPNYCMQLINIIYRLDASTYLGAFNLFTKSKPEIIKLKLEWESIKDAFEDSNNQE